MKPFISTAVYGVLSYIIAFAMMASPWLFGTVHVSSAAFLLPLYIGWLQLIMAIFVDNETGFVKQFPMQISLAVDVFMGFIILVSPWLWGFSHRAFLPQVILGGGLLLLGILTKNSPFWGAPHRAARIGQLESTDSIEGRLNV
jgi:hypothetical protein